MGLMLAICRPQPNWMPRNPKFMFQMAGRESGGCFITSNGGGLLGFAVVADGLALQAVVEGDPPAQGMGFFAGEARKLRGREAPLPVSLGGAGSVQGGCGWQVEQVLGGNDGEA